MRCAHSPTAGRSGANFDETFFSLRLFALLALGSALVLSCGAGRSGAQEGADAFSRSSRASVRSNMPAEATNILLDLLDGYYRIKDGLVADDVPAVKKAAPSVSRSVGRLDTFILTSSSGYYYLWPARDSLRDATVAMSRAASAADLNVVRSHFCKASAALHSMLRLAGLRGAMVYRFYDAAAFNDAGAYWLSYSRQIRNPYFGKKMPEWGEVVDTLR